MTDAPVRIDHLITGTGVGGAEKILADLITRLDPARYQCRLISMKKPGATARRLQQAGVTVLSLDLPAESRGLYFARLPGALARLNRMLREDPPAILHCWLFQANLLGRLAARRAGVAVNISGLRTIEQQRRIQYPLDRITAKMVTAYLAVSNRVARHYEQRLGLPADSILVIPNAIDPAPWQDADGAALRRELGLDPHAPVIGAAGRLHRQKGMDVLLHALPEVTARHPGLTLLIAGHGPERTDLERRAVARNLPVRFLGEWERMSEFMAALDLFVLPSRWEGMPNVILEAMAAAKPIVATAVGGTPELIDDETGTLVPPEDPDALARALLDLIEDPDRRNLMAARAQTKVRRNFSLPVMVQNYERLYQKLLATGDPT